MKNSAAIRNLLAKPNAQIILGILVVLVILSYWSATRTYELTFSPVSQDMSAMDEVVQPTDPKDFTLPDAKGKQVKLSDFKGKPILINFWASWCPPCVQEMPSLLKFAEWARKEGVVVLGVSVDESWQAVDKLFTEKKFWSGSDLPLTILLNKTSDIAEAYGTVKYPESYFIDRNFKVIRKFVGAREWTSQEMMQWVKEHTK